VKLDLYKQAYPHVRNWKYVLVLSEWFKQRAYRGWIATLLKNPDIEVWWAERTPDVRVQLEVCEKDEVKVYLCNYQLVP
jgi:hypothetical protein